MEATLHILVRELSARKQLFVLAAAVSGLAVFVPFLVSFQGESVGDLQQVMGFGLALVTGLILALILGSSVFGHELAEKRLGFFFTLPVGGLSIWIGRMSALYLLILASETIVLLPALVGGAMIAGGFEAFNDVVASSILAPLNLVVVLLIAPALILGIAHAVSVMLRARTLWLLLDLAGIVAAAVTIWFAIYPFASSGFDQATGAVGWGVIASCLAALFAAGAVGVIVGRTDLRRTHGALSLSLWSVLALGLGATGSYAHYLLDFGPLDLEETGILDVSNDSRWLLVGGPGAHRQEVRRSFLVSANDGSYVSLPAVAPDRPWDASWHAFFSGDSSRVVWVGNAADDKPRPIWYADLDRRPINPVETTLQVSAGQGITLSPDGAHLSARDGKVLFVYALDTQSLVAAVRTPPSVEDGWCWFVDEATIRFYALNEYTGNRFLFMADLDLKSTQFEPAGMIPLLDSYELMFSPDRRYVAVAPAWSWSWSSGSPRRERLSAWTIHDGAEGRQLAHFDIDHDVRFIGDYVARIDEHDADHEQLVLESLVDKHRVVHDLEGLHFEGFAGPSWTDGCYVSLGRRSWNRPRLSIQHLDLQTGELRPVGDRLQVVKYLSRPRVHLVRPWPDTDRTSYDLFKRDSSIFQWNRDTGELAHIAGVGAH